MTSARGALAAVVAGFACLALTSAPLSAEAGAISAVCTPSTPGGDYEILLCVGGLTPGTTIQGAVQVSTTVKTIGRASDYEKIVWTIDGGPLLTDFEPNPEFTLDSTDFPDGLHRIVARVVMDDLHVSLPVTIFVRFSNGIETMPVNPRSWSPPTPAADYSPSVLRVTAVGDGASGEAGSAAVVDTIAAGDPQLFLYLGDVYAHGTMTEFRNHYGAQGSAFDRFRSITAPVVGNHESAGAYWDYWDNIGHSYSLDAGGWHLVALDTTVDFGQTHPGTAQYDWLAADLAANDGRCTLVIGHHPRYSVGVMASERRLGALWQLFVDHHVVAYLTGHDHSYQRWYRLDGTGRRARNGVVQLIAGAGGHEELDSLGDDAGLAASSTSSGVVRLGLRDGGMRVSYVTTAGAAIDHGWLPCG